MSGLRIALIGYGEVGQTLAADLLAARRAATPLRAQSGIRSLVAWDRLFPDRSSGPARAIAAAREARSSVELRAAGSMAEVLDEATLVISAVTAGECLAAAREAAATLPQDACYFDLNSVAPSTKTEAAQAIEAAGGRYVEAVVMSPIAPKRSASPMLLGGPHAAGFAPLARELGFTGVEVFPGRFGSASAAKMCRSVMIKGMEALLTESLLAARHYGVEATVLASLRDLLPGHDWPQLARYMISRSLLHGRRRAEEMREVARTVGDAGLDPWMSAACAERQDWAADHRDALEQPGLEPLFDAMLAAPAQKVQERRKLR